MNIRPIQPDELRAFIVAVELTFGSDVNDADFAAAVGVIDHERCLVATDDDGAIVGTAAAHSFDFGVPGTTTPVAGVTCVGVAPTHRRRGLLTALMRQQLDDLHAAGRESIAALFASESAIYGRFGYGLSAQCVGVKVPTVRSRFVEGAKDPGAVRLVTREEFDKAGPAVYERHLQLRPGSFARNDAWWEHRLYDPEHRRHGASSLRYAVHLDGDGKPDGYALYAVKPSWQDGSPAGEVDVREIVTTAPSAARALWRFLLDHDLVASVSAYAVPADSELLHLLADARRATPQLKDNLWVRLVDVQQALTQRRYASDGELVVGVVDAFCPWNEGTYRLVIEAGTARCERTTAPAELTADCADLGAAFLGGTSITSLALAGRVEEHAPHAARRADVLFGWHPRPWCPLVF